MGEHRLLQLLAELAGGEPAPRVTLLVADWCARTGPGDLVTTLGVETVSHAPDWPGWFVAQAPDLVIVHGWVAAHRFREELDHRFPDVPRLVDTSALASLGDPPPLAPLDGDDRGRATTTAIAREADRLLIAGASAVLCASEHEAGSVRELVANVTTTIVRTHAAPPTFSNPRAGRRDVAMLGSFVEGVCSPDEDAVMFVAGEVMPRVRRDADITLHVVGEDASPAIRALTEGVRFHVVRGSVVPVLTTVASVLSVRRFGLGTNAGVFPAIEAGAPVLASAGVASANDLPDALRVDDDPQALAEAIVACVGDDASWTARARATTEWSSGLTVERYRASLGAALAAAGITIDLGAAPAAAEVRVPWAVRRHGRWAPDPAAHVAPSVPMIDLALADQVTTGGVPDPEALLTFPLASPYHEWIRQRDPSPRQRWANEARVAAMPWQPVVSIVISMRDSEPRLLAATIASLRAQVYSRWEACIADDGSTDLETLAALTAAAGDDPRVRLVHVRGDGGAGDSVAAGNGTASAVNGAVERARGEFVGFVPPGVHLEPLALLEIVDLLNRVPELDVVYTDEHEYDPATKQRTNPSLKPSWSPDLLRSGNYLGQLTVFRRALVIDLGGVRADFAGAFEYDLALRATAASDRVGHVAWPLARSDVKRPMPSEAVGVEAGRRALADAVERAGDAAVVEDLDHRGRYRVRYGVVDRPRVGIAIPTRDRHELLAAAIASIRERSTYQNIEITIIDNESRDPETLAYLDRHDGPVLRYDAPFNYARMMNLAIAASDADLLLLLNNDVEVYQPEWIEAMVEHAQRTSVGAVGTRLWFPSGVPQHQGIFVGGIGGAVNADFVEAHYPGNDRHFIAGLGCTVANFAAVTGACLMARPAVLAEVGGFDERLHVAFNDVDLCLKLRARGYDIVCTPFASVVHEESATRGSDHPMDNDDRFRARWRAHDEYEDPYSNPNYDQRRRFALKPTWQEVFVEAQEGAG